jgi:hypothetical protein
VSRWFGSSAPSGLPGAPAQCGRCRPPAARAERGLRTGVPQVGHSLLFDARRARQRERDSIVAARGSPHHRGIARGWGARDAPRDGAAADLMRRRLVDRIAQNGDVAVSLGWPRWVSGGSGVGIGRSGASAAFAGQSGLDRQEGLEWDGAYELTRLIELIRRGGGRSRQTHRFASIEVDLPLGWTAGRAMGDGRVGSPRCSRMP